MPERFTAATKAFGASRYACCDWKKLPLNGGGRALVSRSRRPPKHPGKQWTQADALRVFAIRGALRGRAPHRCLAFKWIA